jgi:hypothetical protein
VIGGYHRCVAETIAHFDGFLAKYMGDGVLVYFGYPQAHEDDAERAVRAGLALGQAALRPKGEALAVRIGIATGLVVLGDLIGSGEAQERGVVGEAPNLAARLQSSPHLIGWIPSLSPQVWRRKQRLRKPLLRFPEATKPAARKKCCNRGDGRREYGFQHSFPQRRVGTLRQ